MKKHSVLITLAVAALVLAGACNGGDAIVDPGLPIMEPPVTVSPVTPQPPVTVTPNQCRRQPSLCD